MADRAVVLTHNWETGETLHTHFDGPDAGIMASAFRASVEDDFPAPEWAWTQITEGETARERLGLFRLGLSEERS